MNSAFPLHSEKFWHYHFPIQAYYHLSLPYGSELIISINNFPYLSSRYCYYTILKDEPSLHKQGIFTPSFAEFTTTNIEMNIEIMRQRGVRFPVICKPTIAHGSKSAHDMIVIFNEKGLNVCKPPCVVQNFVNHNAVLHKVFLIGDRSV